MEYSEIGKPRPRIDAHDQVTGRIHYVGDMQLPGMLYAKPLLSPEHHAKIVRIDTSKAERLAGVRGVATWRDVPHNLSGQVIQDQPIFPVTKVRHRGEVVALVAADTEEIAQAGVDLIEVDYERLPAVFDAREAVQSGAPKIHEEGEGKFCTGNLVHVFGHDCLRLAHGDVEKGFAESDVIVEDAISTSPQRSVPIESHACLARPEANGGVTIWCNTQAPFMVSGMLGPILNLPLSMIRVIVPAIGGTFGMKGEMTIEPKVAVLALKVGLPVRWALTMHENLMYGSSKAPHYMTFKLGLKRDGSLRAIHRIHLSNAGAYASSACISSGKAAMLGSGTYRIPNQLAEVRTVYTNKAQSSPFRGFGLSQSTFAMESMMDIAAHQLGMDPMYIRTRNAIKDGERLGTGQVLHSVGITACLERLRAMSDLG